LPPKWLKTAIVETKGKIPAANFIADTPEGIPLKPIYTKEQTPALPAVSELPGEFPYTRGPHATMYVSSKKNNNNEKKNEKK
jgi:methylmalonyl-CoA mutase